MFKRSSGSPLKINTVMFQYRVTAFQEPCIEICSSNSKLDDNLAKENNLYLNHICYLKSSFNQNVTFCLIKMQ